MSQIDWTALAQQMGTLRSANGTRIESGGTAIGYQAIAEIFGADALRSAVDHYLSFAPGSELARSVLMVLRSPIAMERCLEIFRTSQDLETRTDAIGLLKWISDRRVLAWLPEIISSTDPVVRRWAIGLIDQLLIMQNEIELEEAMPIITMLLNDADWGIREQARELLDMIKENP